MQPSYLDRRLTAVAAQLDGLLAVVTPERVRVLLFERVDVLPVVAHRTRRPSVEEDARREISEGTVAQLILWLAPGVSNEGRSPPPLVPCRRFVALGSGLRLVGTASSRR